MHDVAEVPEAVPVALFHLLLVERERRVELILDPFLSGRTNGPAVPTRRTLGRMQILRATDQQRRLRAIRACDDRLLFRGQLRARDIASTHSSARRRAAC